VQPEDWIIRAETCRCNKCDLWCIFIGLAEHCRHCD